MQQKAAPSANKTNATQFIKSEFNTSDFLTTSSVNNGEQTSNTDSHDVFKPKTIYGVVG